MGTQMIGWLTSFFRRKQQEPWDLRQLHRVIENEVERSLARGEVEPTEIDSVVADALTDSVDESADLILSDLKRTTPRMIREHRRMSSGFQKLVYRRWKEGLDLLKALLVASQEAGVAYNQMYRPAAVENQDVRFQALVNLHARALRVSEEIYSLLLAGYPDGALGRWRTLHEIAVIMTFLEENEPSVSERFILHREVVNYRAMKQYRDHQDRAKLMPITDEELTTIKNLKDSIVEEHGPEMMKDYGWAAPALGIKNPNFSDIEKGVELDHWRPRVKWASGDIHGAYQPFGASLGTSESKEELLLVGASSSGFTDPAHMTAVSLNLANRALFSANSSLDLAIILRVLNKLSEKIGDTFLRIGRETSPNAG